MWLKNRISPLRICQFVAIGILLVPALARGQAVVATVPGGGGAIALNATTNKIYVVAGISRTQGGTVTVIDGATNSFINVPVGINPRGIAVNEVTNKIYIANVGCATPFSNCSNPGSITVLDGATNSTTTLVDPNANGPSAVAVNSVTDKIYVANSLSGNVTVIDGATNSVTTVSDPNAHGLSAWAIATNPITNKIYVTNNSFGALITSPGNVTVIDGGTNATTTVTDPNAVNPIAVAVNTVADKIYVANLGPGTFPSTGNITLIDGATNSTATIADTSALNPNAVAVNTITNKIYVVNGTTHNVTVIDGATNSTTTVDDANASHSHALGLDEKANQIYVANEGCFQEDGCNNPGSITVIDGETNSKMTLIAPNFSHAEGVAVNPITHLAYVPYFGATVVIDGTATATSHMLSILLAGNGSGTITSSPAGINCGTSCTASFASGMAISLTASPASGSTFSGWSTACSGTGRCDVTMTSDGFVTATFDTGSPPDFSLTPASASLTAQRRGQVTDVITIAAQNGSFGSAIQLACTVSGSTPTATCGLSPNSVTPGANSATSTLTVTAPGLSAWLTPFGEGQVSSPLYAVFLPIPLALIGFGLVSRRPKERRRQLWLLCSLFLVFVALQTGCGGGSGNQLTPPPPLNYTVTVTATSGAIQHTTPVTVTVQ
jgi:DNA-binding beta-propeller fold protein YncE